jgi:VanZ family protein
MRRLGANPAWILLHSWVGPPAPFLLRDVFVNVLIYIPLGACAYLALRGYGRRVLSLCGPVLLGITLSSVLEMAQLYFPPRNCSALDVLSNGLGAAIGVAVALSFHASLARPFPRPEDRGALALLLCWIACELFPFFPVLGRTELARKLTVMASSPLLDPLILASSALAVFIAGRLIVKIGAVRVWPWLGAIVLLVPAQMFIVTRQPVPSELLGAATGCALFAATRRYSLSNRMVAGAMLGLILARGLAPFTFRMESSAFNWIPFAGSLESQWQPAVLILLQKLFYYWAAIWALRAAGTRLLTATMVVASALGLTEAVQTHLPGRTPETTDPVMALLIGLSLDGAQRKSSRR